MLTRYDHGDLKAQHEHGAIAACLAAKKSHGYVGDAVLGAIDGCVTTFAVVSGVSGAHLLYGVVLVLGLANLCNDDVSMAVSNYHKAMSDVERTTQARRREERHINSAAHVPVPIVTEGI